MRNLPLALLIALLGSGALAGCGHSGKSMPTANNIANINFTANASSGADPGTGDSSAVTMENGTGNTVVNAASVNNSSGSGTGSDASNTHNASHDAHNATNTTQDTSNKANSSPAQSKPKPTSTAKANDGKGGNGRTSGHVGTTTTTTKGSPADESSAGSSNANHSSSKSTGDSSSPAKPSGLDATWTNVLNRPYTSTNYAGPNSVLFDGLVIQMAEGEATPEGVKATILGLQPWDAVWTTANNGDGKTYQYQVHDVGAFTFQTKTLNDNMIAQEWQDYGKEVLDDSAYAKWAVYWNASTGEYTVAYLDVGFYYGSVLPSQNTSN